MNNSERPQPIPVTLDENSPELIAARHGQVDIVYGSSMSRGDRSQLQFQREQRKRQARRNHLAFQRFRARLKPKR